MKQEKEKPNDALQMEMNRIINLSGDIEGAIMLHAEIVTHLADRFANYFQRKPSEKEREKIISIANHVVKNFFEMRLPIY